MWWNWINARGLRIIIRVNFVCLLLEKINSIPGGRRYLRCGVVWLQSREVSNTTRHQCAALGSSYSWCRVPHRIAFVHLFLGKTTHTIYVGGIFVFVFLCKTSFCNRRCVLVGSRLVYLVFSIVSCHIISSSCYCINYVDK